MFITVNIVQMYTFLELTNSKKKTFYYVAGELNRGGSRLRKFFQRFRGV